MALKPNIQRERAPFFLYSCSKCKAELGPDSYARTKSIFYPSGYIPICNSCIKEILIQEDFSWDIMDRLCMYMDIPFIPKEFETLKEMNGEDVFPVYAEVFLSSEYERIGWGDYYKAFTELQESGELESELPLLDERERKALKEKWGYNYDDEALRYLENLYQGLLKTQNVNGALQIDQALKICRISHAINMNDQDGQRVEKLLVSYDKLIKTADFTPKNTKNAGDFESVGEFIRWLEQSGYENKFYDGEKRDVVDETIQSFQNYVGRLYTHESGIGEEINRKVEGLRAAAELEKNLSYYGTDEEYDLDSFEKEGYERLFEDLEEEEFQVDLGEEEDS